MIVAVTSADATGWVCLVVGLLVLLAGVVLGLVISLRKAPADAKETINDAKRSANDTKMQIQAATQPGLVEGADAAAEAATASAEATESAIKQLEGIISSLPEKLRFSGLLVLVGTVLISVATIQFGKVSLF